MNLKNKTIIVTGASDGIGKQIAFRLAKENTNLILIARNKKRLDSVKKQSMKSGALKVKTYICDIRKIDSLEKTAKSIIYEFKKIDVLINNAGIWQKLGPIEKIKKQTINDIISTNLTGLIHTTRLFIPTLKKTKESAIINISSKSGILPQEGQSVYTASKYGVRGFTEVLELDLKNTNIKVAGIYQGGINTDMFKKTGEKFSTDNFANPDDLADVIAYILKLPKKIWISHIKIDR
ncbi:MAG: SDR family NAD(P)-dependent oxidoreductase [Patescibacteria group bacterium]|nr:SDR family NAD(P)-dependent oxidoreductase [Patescibacteria group bacterium]